jgi:transposase-like protein
MSIPAHKDQRRKLTPEDKAEIIELRSQGWTLRAIAEKYGISQTQVRRVLGAAQ